MFKYRVYGLNVHSNQQLDCYPHNFDIADIIIEFTDSENGARRYVDQIIGGDECTEIGTEDGLGKFFFCGDKHIAVYYQNEDYLKRYLIHVLFGFGFSYLLRRRKVFFLHGSGVIIDGSAVIIVGKSESGKSTLAACLVKQNGRIISDDTTRLELDAETPYIYPSYPLRRLYRNTIEHLGLSMEGASEIISRDNKFAFMDDGQNVFLNREAPVKAIVRIAPADTNEVCLVREDVKQSITIICRNVYNYQLISRSEFAGDYMAFALDVCDRIPVYTLSRPTGSITVEEQAKTILKEIYNRGKL
jgi:energy-coupling factor transporter ATP-binding protein EcfA2